MLFNSYIFILCFLPITFALYFIMRYLKYNKLAKIALMGMSLWFYGYFNYHYLEIIIASILINYTLVYLINHSLSSKNRKLIMAIGLFFNIGLIFYFKYFDFFINNINHLFGSGLVMKNIMLPLGISFFTFQQISFLVDSYRKELNEAPFIDYALSVCFFPHLIAGPIVLYKELLPQFNDEKKFRINYDNIAHGLYIFSIGLFKKIIIADTFARAVNWGYGAIDIMSSMDVFIIMLSYTFQIYFDFSAYCDMAVGLAKMFNFELPQNFNSPYKAKSIIEFWDRWHMTLTRFLKTYIYFPLGGSRKGNIRTYVNIMIVFLVSGLWHGANWTFILWGALHGIANIINRIFKKQWSYMNDVVQWMITFAFVNITWLFFRSENIGQAVILLKRLVSCGSTAISADLMDRFMLPEINFISWLPVIRGAFSKINGLPMWIFILVALMIVLNLKNISEIRFKSTFGRAVLTSILLVWSIVSLSGVSIFLYFNF